MCPSAKFVGCRSRTSSAACECIELVSSVCGCAEASEGLEEGRWLDFVALRCLAVAAKHDESH